MFDALERRRADRLFRCWQQASPDRTVRVRVPRLIPRTLVDLGQLAGLVYRSTRGAGRLETYVHFFDDPPRLTAAPDGRRLFLLGGSYRVTRRGIEG